MLMSKPAANLSHVASPQSRLEASGQVPSNLKEWPSYEQSRGEDLRRQIRQKEAELEHITTNKDKIRMRMVQNSLQGRLPGQDPVSSDSHLQHQSQSYQSQQYSRQNLPMNNTIISSPPPLARGDPQASGPEFLSSFRLNPQTNNDSTIQQQQLQNQSAGRAVFTPSTPPIATSLGNSGQQRPSIQQNHELMNTVQTENSQMQRRLVLVTQELERVTADRNEAMNHLHNLTKQTDSLNAQVNHEQGDNSQQNQTNNALSKETQLHDVLHQKMVEAQAIAKEATQRTFDLQNQRAAQQQSIKEMYEGLENKNVLVKDIESQLYYNQSRLDSCENEIQELDRSLHSENDEISKLADLRQRLMYERDDLYKKSAQLNLLYENTVEEISMERGAIRFNNRRHLQLLAAKVIAGQIQELQQVRKQEIFSEVIAYGKFDFKCHSTLARFGQVLEKCGRYQMSIAIKRWFQNAHKPLEVQQQSYDLAGKYYLLKLRKRVLLNWKCVVFNNKSLYGRKLDAVSRIWNIKCFDTKADIRRAFTIWRDIRTEKILKERRLRIIIARHESNSQQRAMTVWRLYNLEMNAVLRKHILITDMTQKQQKLIAFHQLRARIAFKRRLRLSKLAHLFKGWRDSNSYYKLMISSNVLVGRLRRQIDLKTLSNCFNAIRNAKEYEKLTLVSDKLNLDVIPTSEDLTRYVQCDSYKALKDKRLRGLRTLSKQATAHLTSYFTQWLSLYKDYKWKVRKNLMELVVRAYKLKMHTAFGVWQHGHGFYKIQTQLIKQYSLRKIGLQLTQDVNLVSRWIENEQDRIARATRQIFHRVSKTYYKFKILHGLITWQNKNRRWKLMETYGSSQIFKILRENYLVQAFNQYRQVTDQMRQTQMDEERADHYLQTRSDRMLRRSYNAICQYVNQYSAQKRLLGILMRNVDVWLKRRTYHRWQDQGNVKQIDYSRDTQNNETQVVDDLNQDLGKVVKVLNTHEEENIRKFSELRRMGQKLLGNFFARFYYTKAHRGVQKWKQFTKFHQHREHVLLSATMKWRDNWNFMAKRAFERFTHHKRCSELNNQIKYKVGQIYDEETLITHQRTVHQEFEVQNQVCQKVCRDQQRTFELRQAMIKHILTKLNQENNLQHHQRLMIQKWSNYAKRKSRFCQSLVTSLTKSVWKNGFEELLQFSRDKLLTRLQNKHLTGMVRMYKKQQCRYYYSKMRENRYFMYKNKTKEVRKITDDEIERFDEFKQRTIDHQWAMLEPRKRRQKQLDVWKAWKVVHIWQRYQKVGTYKCQENIASYEKKRALLKWRNRQLATIKCRQLISTFNHKRRLIYLRACLNGLKGQFKAKDTFSTKLSDIAAKFDNLQLQIAMRKIRYFARNRLFYELMKKRVASRSLGVTLKGLFMKRLRQNMSELRRRAIKLKFTQLTIGAMLGHMSSYRVRLGFFRWRDQAKKVSVELEVDEVGPVVEEVHHHQLRDRNMKYFLRDEAYTPIEIHRISQWARGRTKEYLARTITRMQHYDSKDGDKYLKPKMFDRWKLFTRVRKLIRYLLNNMENRMQPVKADLSVAFIRWKQACFNHDYMKTRQQLVEKATHKDENARRLAAVLMQAEDFKEQMQMQRDELIEKYIGSQRLAIAQGRNNLEKKTREGLSQLSDHALFLRNNEITQSVQKNIDFISQIKDKMKEFENDSEQIANENEELRQFSMNGYQIAKNVQQLQQEREALSVDLADKATTIKELLNQNDALNARLQNVNNTIARSGRSGMI